jgi:hypothetical protein
MLRSDPEKVRAWQQRSRSNLRRTELAAGRKPLPQRSPRKAERWRAIADACGEAVRRDGSVCCAGPLDPQHLFPRLVDPTQVANPEAIIAACRSHHEWIGDHPAEANRLGLHAFSGDDLAELAERRQSAQDRRLRPSERFP